MSNGNNNPSYLQEYMSSFDDERRISDILRNRNPTPPASNPFGTNNGKVDNYNDAKPSIYSNRKSIFGQKIHSDPHFDRPGFGEPFFRDSFTGITRFNFAPHFNNNFQTYKGFVANHGPFEVFSRPISVHDGTLKTNKPAIDFSFWNDHYPTKYQNTFTNHLNQYRGQEFLNNVHKNQGIITKPKQNELITGSYDTGKTFRPIIGNTYSFETNGIKNSNGGFKDNSEIWNPGLLTAFRGFGAKITEKSKCECVLSILFSISLFVGKSPCKQYSVNVFSKNAIQLNPRTQCKIDLWHLDKRKHKSPSLTRHRRKTGDTNLRLICHHSYFVL